MSTDTRPPEIRDGSTENAVEGLADTIGQMMEFWGFKHIMGRIWTILYMSSQPMSAPDLADRLKASSGSVSMALQDLLKWGAIRKVCPRDSRKDHFVAEDNFWKLLTRVLTEREARRIETTRESLDETLRTLQAAESSPETATAEIQFQKARIQELKRLSSVASQILKMLVLSAKVDATPLRRLFDPRISTDVSPSAAPSAADVQRSIS